jgi:alkanesulfonate monooxygenase SsuD/methylene tetrahydromethanopterin reductase-like flavin-dependent oxidoreductase (luciferase family)
MTLRCEVAYDFFYTPSSPVPLEVHYRSMLDQVEYADDNGFAAAYFTEHHGALDNYLPAPLIAAAAAAARTRRMRLITVLLAPFYDPIKLAEDIAVLDLVSSGRASPVLAAGYVDSEFEMFAKEMRDRRTTVDSTASFLRRVWTDGEAELEGRRVRVTPRPVQRPHPPITMGGMSSTGARAAARYADDYMGPEHLRDVFRQERIQLGMPDPGPGLIRAPWLHVTEDPDRDWPLVAPFVLGAIGNYLEWTTQSAKSGRPGSTVWEVRSEEELRASPYYRIVTPEECVEIVSALGDDVLVRLQPGWGGYSPELAWSSLELFVSRVLPFLRTAATTL